MRVLHDCTPAEGSIESRITDTGVLELASELCRAQRGLVPKFDSRTVRRPLSVYSGAYELGRYLHIARAVRRTGVERRI